MDYREAARQAARRAIAAATSPYYGLESIMDAWFDGLAADLTVRRDEYEQAVTAQAARLSPDDGAHLVEYFTLITHDLDTGDDSTSAVKTLIAQLEAHGVEWWKAIYGLYCSKETDSPLRRWFAVDPDARSALYRRYMNELWPNQ